MKAEEIQVEPLVLGMTKTGPRHKYHCKICGKPISRWSKTGLCRECRGKLVAIRWHQKARLRRLLKRKKQDE